jgi:chaperone modulatory protein CbpM
MKKDIIIIADYTEDNSLTLEEICEIYEIKSMMIREMIDYDIVEPRGSNPDEWMFDMAQIKKLRTALRLQRDFEINLAGIALVLDLLEQMEDLRAKTELLDKHLLK